MKGITDYQMEILGLVKRGEVAGKPDPIDFDQLLEALSWKPTKQSAQFSIRACVRKGLIRKAELQLRRGRKRVCYEMTEAGKRALDPRPAVSSSTSFVPGVPLDDVDVAFDESLLDDTFVLE